MKKLAYIFYVFALASCVDSYVHPCEDELRRLDRTLDQMDEYVTIKESRISAISEALEDPQLTLSQRYSICGRLYEEYLPYQEDIFRMMFECEPYIRNIAELGKVFLNSSYTSSKPALFLAYKQIKDATPIVPTKHGKHVIAKPFNVQSLTEKWKQYCQDNGITMPLPRTFVDPENKYTTFELTDAYLPIAKEFESFLPDPQLLL